MSTKKTEKKPAAILAKPTATANLAEVRGLAALAAVLPRSPTVASAAEFESLKTKLEQAKAEQGRLREVLGQLVAEQASKDGDLEKMRERAVHAEGQLSNALSRAISAEARVNAVHALLLEADAQYFAELRGHYNILPNLKAIAEKLRG